MDDKIYRGPGHPVGAHFHSGPKGERGLPGVSPKVDMEYNEDDGTVVFTVSDGYGQREQAVPVSERIDEWTDEHGHEAIDQWLDDHPEATTTVEDGSITVEKFAESAKAYVDKSASTRGWELKPHASFMDVSDTSEFHTPGTVASFQGSCEYAIDGHTYLAIGVVYTDEDSGIILLKDGAVYNSVKGNSFGHVNSITYCDKNECLYISYSGGGSPANIYSLNAVTLASVGGLPFSSSSIWYDPASEYFYLASEGNVCRFPYSEADPENNYEVVYTREVAYTHQMICAHKNRILDVQWESSGGVTHIFEHDLSGAFVAEHCLHTYQEGECLYSFDDHLYLGINGTFYNTDGTTAKQYTIVELTPINMVDVTQSNEDAVHYDSTAGVYGTGSLSSPTSSPIAALLDRRHVVQVSGAFILPHFVLKTPRMFVGHSASDDVVDLFSTDGAPALYWNVTVSNYTGGDAYLQNARVAFKECVFRSDEFITLSKPVLCYACDLTFDQVTFYNHCGSLDVVFSSVVSTINNVTVFAPSFDIISASGNAYSKAFFYRYFRVRAYGYQARHAAKAMSYLVREFDSVHYDAFESGSFNVNDFLCNDLVTSFATGCTLTNAPVSSGRRVLKTVQAGTTSGLIQIMLTKSAVYLREITGVGVLSFDGNGDVSFPDLNPGPWIEVEDNSKIYWTKTNNEVLGKYGHYYVDGTDGSDSNDGTTQATAFKTLAPVWRAVKKGDIEIRVSLNGGSTYTWEPYNITSMSVHLASYGTGNATISLPSNTDVAFYNCHMKVAGTANSHIVFSGANSVYFDGGSIHWTYAECPNLALWSCGAYMNHCAIDALTQNNSNANVIDSTMGGIYGYCGNLRLDGCTFDTGLKHPASNDAFIWMDSSVTTILGNTYVIITDPFTNGDFIFAKGGTLTLLAGAQVTNEGGTLFKNGIDLAGALLMSTTARANSFSYVATTAYDVYSGGFTNLV